MAVLPHGSRGRSATQVVSGVPILTIFLECPGSRYHGSALSMHCVAQVSWLVRLVVAEAVGTLQQLPQDGPKFEYP